VEWFSRLLTPYSFLHPKLTLTCDLAVNRMPEWQAMDKHSDRGLSAKPFVRGVNKSFFGGIYYVFGNQLANGI